MKIRIDYVTNSSSSSFVVRVKNDTKISDIEKFIKEYEMDIIEANDFYETPENTFKFLQNYLIDILKHGKLIDGWKVKEGHYWDSCLTGEGLLNNIKSYPTWLDYDEKFDY